MLKPIVTEIQIPTNDEEGRTIYASERIIIRVKDEAGGPFLAVWGE
jgi:hypothetical protein